MTGYIRRAKGLHAIRTPHLRSRDGSTLLYNLTAHSLFRFNDVQIQAAGGSLYRAGAVVASLSTAHDSGFIAMPAQPGLDDSLFITGGGRAIKLDDGGSVTTWGITNPGGPPSSLKPPPALAHSPTGPTNTKSYSGMAPLGSRSTPKTSTPPSPSQVGSCPSPSPTSPSPATDR